MKLTALLNRRLEFACLAILLFCGFAARGEDAVPAGTNSTPAFLLSDDADKAWKQVQKANQAPFPPAEWSTNSPTQQQQNDFFAPKLLKASDMAAEFYTRFPKHEKAPAAHAMELMLVKMAITKFDQTNQMTRLAALEEKQLNDPNASEDDKIRVRMEKLAALQQDFPATVDAFVAGGRALIHDYPKRSEGWQVLLFAVAHTEGDKTETLSKEILEGDAPDKVKSDAKMILRVTEVRKLMAGLPETSAALEKDARDLIKDYPDQSLGYQVLLFLIQNSGPDKAKALAAEIAASPAPEGIKQQAQAKLKAMERLNRPLDIQYSAVDGREVNLATMKNKVVLVDFWATWCGPCMAELPNVKAAYAKYHDQGFEIIGISLDDDKDKLEKTLKSKGMTWPQYFDGLKWENKFTKEYGIQAIPAMWLVDKQGKLSDMDAENGLEKKIEKLLAQK